MTKTATSTLLLILSLFVVGCTSPPASNTDTQPTALEPTVIPTSMAVPNPTTITVKELKTMLQSKDFVLINVHIPYEGEIPGTDAHIPYNEMEKYADQLPQYKDVKIVLYCRSGSMSAAASKTLVEMGYTHVIDVLGGMNAWRAAGYELLNKPQTAASTASNVAAVAPTSPPSAATATPVAPEVRRITPADAKTLLDDGAAILYDTRSPDAYRTEHAAGAVSFPEDTVGAHYGELPTDKVLIFYCT